MRIAILSTIALASAAPALAQQTDPARIVRPYWWDRPVVEVVGRGQAEATPNRARFAVAFTETDREPAKALRRATDRATSAAAAMRRELGSDARISTDITNGPYYQQYKDKSGEMVDDERPDKVQGYSSRVTLTVELRDVNTVARARAAALAVGLEQSGRINYYLDETPKMQQDVIRSAAQDARARAQAAAMAAGATLGDLLVLQEGEGGCIGGWSSRQVARQTNGDALQLMNGRRVQDAPLPAAAMEAVEVLKDGASATYGAGAVGGVANFVTVTASRRTTLISDFDLGTDPEPRPINSTVCAVYALR